MRLRPPEAFEVTGRARRDTVELGNKTYRLRAGYVAVEYIESGMGIEETNWLIVPAPLLSFGQREVALGLVLPVEHALEQGVVELMTAAG